MIVLPIFSREKSSSVQATTAQSQISDNHLIIKFLVSVSFIATIQSRGVFFDIEYCVFIFALVTCFKLERLFFSIIVFIFYFYL
ncbi:TPA: hypothetical protein DCZ31_01985 [Patescibacteria group bacterium]|nr:hypothetical protein [Candidatus Gracilibacteria bacterium]